MAALAAGLTAGGGEALARPYLMLFADDKGFVALDLADMARSGDEAQATLIRSPLAGVPFGATRADLLKARVSVDCLTARWRTLSTAYADARETVLGSDPGPGPWRPLSDDPAAPAVRDAACYNRFAQQSVSRELNLGQIVTHYRRAWAKPEPEPLTEKQLEDQRYKAGH